MKAQYANINPNKLHDELIAAGITPVLVENDCPVGAYVAPNTWIIFTTDTDVDKVAQIEHIPRHLKRNHRRLKNVWQLLKRQF